MAGVTLKQLAGATFRANDVTSAMHAPLTPEQQVLDRYVFLPHARTGIAAALKTAFAWSLPTRATVGIRVPVNDDRGAIDAEMQMHVSGPADVLEIDQRQVIRTFPKADTANAEVDDLAHVEFDRPDLPWLFTPAGPDGAGRLVPWISLVVSERRHLEWGEHRGAVRLARIRRDQLQPLDDAWAWAHAQVMGAKLADAAAEPTLERRLSEANARHNLSRLVCPRRLDVRTHYVACVVPTFLAGAQVAMGMTPVGNLAPAWGSAVDFNAGDPWEMVQLPVYFAWEFVTGEAGNFESLARRLKPAIAPPGVGRRRVDATHPWPGEALDAGDPGAEIVVAGPVVSPQAPADTPEEGWPSEAQQHWTAAVTQGLVDKLNLQDKQAHEPDPGPPLVGPPLYGGVHAKQAVIEDDPAGQPPWFRQLNTDPRNRIVAGLGTRVVQAEQEDLMRSAWNQVAGVEAANRAFRLAQLAKRVATSLHRRHFSRLSDGQLLGMTERVHAKVLTGPERTVWADLGESALPRTVTTGAFRRLVRPRGLVLRASIESLQARRAATDALTVQADRLTTSWVLPYISPDGVSGLSDVAAARVSPEIAGQIEPGAQPEALLERWHEALARPAAPDLLDRRNLRPPDNVDLGRPFVTAVLRRLLRSAPSLQRIGDDRQAAVGAASRAVMLRALLEIAGDLGMRELPVHAADAGRLELPVRGARLGEGRISAADLLGFADRLLELARNHRVALPGVEIERRRDQLRSLAANRLSFDGGAVVHALGAVGAKAVLDDRFADPPRARISAPALGLLGKLDPAITIPARIRARLKAGSDRAQALADDWFAGGRIEPVMACPRFEYPMYEPLNRYDREWMIPGLGLIQKPEMATLLQTNNRFIEAYMVGLNHEMARELLWRDYPTDQRGTYFASFWTGEPELVADLHMPPWAAGTLGGHVKKELDGRLVFLVRGELIRRYPGVMAHAAREAASDRGVPILEANPAVDILFHIVLPPNVLLVGFSLTKERVTQAGETWWLTLQENPTEPRFGLDPSRAGPISRDNLIWSDFGVSAAGQFLSAARGGAVAFDDSRWGFSSAQMAYLLFQLPARAAFRATKMVEGATLHG